jgi:glycosyltransferase involved in cell wall biosynthesis
VTMPASPRPATDVGRARHREPVSPPHRPRLVAISHTGLFSGAERVLVNYLTAAARSWDVSCLTPAGALSGRLTAAGVEHRLIPELKLPAGPRPAAMVRLSSRWLRAARIVRAAAARADIVLVNGVLALPAVRLAGVGVPVVWLVHDVIVRRDLRLVARSAGGVVDLAIGVSDAATGVAAELGLPIRVVRNGTPWPVEPSAADPTAAPIVGVNALLTPWKGQHVMLDAAALLPPDVRIELMGGHFPKDDPYLASLHRRAGLPDLAGRVCFTGLVDDPLGRMRSWTVAVSASVEPEAGSLAVLEAMSLGLPVVATDHGGPKEVLDGIGELVTPNDPQALADGIRRLLADPDRRRQAGAAARERVASSLSLDRVSAEFLGVLDGVLGRVGATMEPTS